MKINLEYTIHNRAARGNLLSGAKAGCLRMPGLFVLDGSEQDAIASSCGKTRVVFANHMHVLSVLRNKCCHGARLYNTVFHPSVQLGRYYLKKHPEVAVDTLFAAILALLRFAPTQDAKEKWCAELCACIQKYRVYMELEYIGFPQNYEQLLRNEWQCR